MLSGENNDTFDKMMKDYFSGEDKYRYKQLLEKEYSLLRPSDLLYKTRLDAISDMIWVYMRSIRSIKNLDNNILDRYIFNILYLLRDENELLITVYKKGLDNRDQDLALCYEFMYKVIKEILLNIHSKNKNFKLYKFIHEIYNEITTDILHIYNNSDYSIDYSVGHGYIYRPVVADTYWGIAIYYLTSIFYILLSENNYTDDNILLNDMDRTDTSLAYTLLVELQDMSESIINESCIIIEEDYTSVR